MGLPNRPLVYRLRNGKHRHRNFSLLVGAIVRYWSNFMDFDDNLISHTLEHRGCGIRAASYEVCPKSWLPEACVWLRTDAGNRKLWVQSFVHCFTAEQLTFPNRLDADSWAFIAAKSIIDRALPQATYRSPQGRYLSRVLRMARHPISILGDLRRSRSRH